MLLNNPCARLGLYRPLLFHNHSPTDWHSPPVFLTPYPHMHYTKQNTSSLRHPITICALTGISSLTPTPCDYICTTFDLCIPLCLIASYLFIRTCLCPLTSHKYICPSYEPLSFPLYSTTSFSTGYLVSHSLSLHT